MKKKAQHLLVLSSLLLCLGLSSCNGSTPSSASSEESVVPSLPSSSESEEPIGGQAIKLTSPENGSSFSVSNNVISSYLNASSDKAAIDILEANKGKDLSTVSIDLSWEKDGSAYYEVYLDNDPSFSNPSIRKVSGLTPHLKITNLIPGSTYYWKVIGTVDSDVSETRSFSTEGTSVRLINASGGKNIRDLGGWKTNNNSKLSYGKLYRGGLLNGYNSLAKLDEEGIKTFRDELGIKTEIDLRRTSIDDALQDSCFFNPEAKYIQAELGQYTGVLDIDSWKSLDAATSSAAVSTCDGYSAPSIKKIFAALSDENNYPVYFHCNAGADRTGTLAFLIEAICGVSESDLIKDFEITSFSSFGARYRSKLDGDSFDPSGVYTKGSGNFVAFGALLESFKTYYGNSLQEAATYFLNAKMGVPMEQIEKVKSILMEDYEKEDSITLGQTQEILLTSSTKSITLPEVEYDSISSITMDGISLGNDISSLDFSGFGSLGGIKEIAVTVTKGEASKKVYVPVDIITKEISTKEQLKEAIDFTKSSNLFGHYRLLNDIDFGSSHWGGGYSSKVNYFDSRGAEGFRGIFDGNGYTIRGASGYGGLFGTVGAGAIIKNVTIIDNDYKGTESTNVFGTCVVSATIENVTFKMNGEGSDIAKNGVGWISSYQNQGNVYKNVVFDASGCKIGNLFGGYLSWMGTANVSFANCSIKCASIVGLGVKSGQNTTVSIYGISGLSGEVGDKVLTKNTITVGSKEAKLQLGSVYNKASLLSLSYKGHPIAGAEMDEGNIYFPVAGVFSNADEGQRELLAVVQFEGGMKANVSIGVEVISSYEKVELQGKTTVDLEKQSSFSIDLEAFAGATVSSMMLGDISLGTNPNNISVPSSLLNDKTLHGEQTIKIVASMNGVDYSITAKALFITKTFMSFADMKETIGHYDESTCAIYGYYKVGQDLGSSSSEYHWYYSEAVSSKAWTSLDRYGFQGTIDGDGHSITGKTATRTWGMFGYMGDNACLKNITINDYGELGGAERALLGRKIGNALFQDVNFNFLGTGSRTSDSGTGWISTWSVASAKFINVNFNAEGKEMGTLFGANTGSFTAEFSNSTLTCSYIECITKNGTYYSVNPNNVTGLTYINK